MNRFVYSCRTPSKEDGKRKEIVKQINAQDFMEYRAFMVKGSLELLKEVCCFIYDNTYYQIEFYKNTGENLVILRVEGNQQFKKEELPSFLKVKEDITENPDYFSYYLAVGKNSEKKAEISI